MYRFCGEKKRKEHEGLQRSRDFPWDCVRFPGLNVGTTSRSAGDESLVADRDLDFICDSYFIAVVFFFSVYILFRTKCITKSVPTLYRFVQLKNIRDKYFQERERIQRETFTLKENSVHYMSKLKCEILRLWNVSLEFSRSMFNTNYIW